MGVDPSISVCIVTGGRLEQLSECLQSLAHQVKAPPTEVLVCANGDPEVEPVVRQWFPAARVALVPHTRLGAARNMLIRQATGDLLLFLDDDVAAHPRLLQRLAEAAIDHPEAAVFGGPNLNPPGRPLVEVVQGGVLASMVASGPVRRRYGTHPAGPADERFFTLCNLAVRREVMIEFPADVTGGEENAVLWTLAERDVPMRYDPELRVFHQRRPSVGAFARQMHKYGSGRGEVIVRMPASARAMHFAPSALLAYLAVAPFAAALVHPVALLPAMVYAALVATTAVKVAMPLRAPSAVLLAGQLVLVLHAAYGVGVVSGLLRRPARVEHPVPVWSDATAT
jgi:cellulose synthase/poly-beta-1,6-N-acetylglucosamine synthase-like glycosyltransferase